MSSSSRKRAYRSMGAQHRQTRSGSANSAANSAAAASAAAASAANSTASSNFGYKPMALTSDAIGRMLRGETMTEPFVVKLLEPRRVEPEENDYDEDDVGSKHLRDSKFSAVTTAKATLCDNGHFHEVILLNHCERELLDQGTCCFIVSIHGYVTSSCNSSTTTGGDYLAITRLYVLQKQSIPRHQRETSVSSHRSPIHGLGQSLQGGGFASFLIDRVPFFSNDDLAGKGLCRPGGSLESSIRRVSQCLAHHAAMVTLKASSNVAETTISSATSSQSNFYHQALNEFFTSQMDRQKASLTSNAGREDASRSHLVIEKYSEALNAALLLVSGSSLTASRLQMWHSMICGDGLHAKSGEFRSTNVRAGCTSFCPADQLPSHVENLIQGLNSLQSRLFLHNGGGGIIPSVDTDPIQLGWRAITFAAAVVFGILDVHPFADGNGRLSRVAMNWALAYAGLPFVVNLFATPAQRQEYVTAILETRRNTTLVARGDVSDEAFHDACCNAGLLFPLMEVIADRVARAATEFQNLYEEKSKLATEQAEARAARQFRERAAQGSCLICFDEKPNIATLCCGKAVHLNCMAEWLSSNNSCPQCRAEMPALVTTGRAASVSDANEIDDTSTVEDNVAVEDDTNESDDHTTEEIVPAMANATGFFQLETADDSYEETTESVDETVETHQQQPQHMFCGHLHCRNKAAVDCSVGYCGRCCVLYAMRSCPRHNH